VLDYLWLCEFCVLIFIVFFLVSRGVFDECVLFVCV